MKAIVLFPWQLVVTLATAVINLVTTIVHGRFNDPEPEPPEEEERPRRRRHDKIPKDWH